MADSNKKLIQRGVSSIEETETAINEKAREEYVEAQDAVTLEVAKAYTDEQVATCETPAGAQDKADAAAQVAQEAAITAAAAHSDTALKAHTDTVAIHKTSEQIRAEIVDADIPATLARVTAVDTKDAATLEAAKGYTDTKVAALVDGAPETLDTLKEIAEVLKANEDGAAAMLEVIGTKADAEATTAALAGKVDKEEGKGLSSNDYTSAEREKLAGLDSYTLPAASPTVLGGVKAGANVEIDAEGRLSATAEPYNLPKASASVLGGIKIGNNLTVDADGRLNAPAGGGGSGGEGESNVLILPWVEPVFDANPDLPTNQQEFTAAWGPAIEKYAANPGKYHVIMNIQVGVTPIRLDCQLIPQLDISGSLTGYSIAATAIMPMEIESGKIIGLRQYQSVGVLVSNSRMTEVNVYQSSPMIDMEAGLPNYLLDSVSGGGGGTAEGMDYSSLAEQEVPGEFWLSLLDGSKKQVYCRTFTGIVDSSMSTPLMTGVEYAMPVAGYVLAAFGDDPAGDSFRMSIGQGGAGQIFNLMVTHISGVSGVYVSQNINPDKAIPFVLTIKYIKQ